MKVSVGLVALLYMLTLRLGWSFPPCLENERTALLEFKKGVMDPSNMLSSWEGGDCCKWYAVGCSNQTGHVVKLDLRNRFPYDPSSAENYGLLTVVKVYPSLVELQHLSYLDLSNNNFSGVSIPNFFWSFPNLRYFNLSFSQFNGVVPHHLGNLSSSLISLDLSYTHLYLDSFDWISTLSSLQYLNMNQVALFDINNYSLPSDLLELRLSNCMLSNFPHSLNNLTSLLILDLSSNYVEDQILNPIWNMSALESLDLSSNKLNCSKVDLEGFRNLRNLVKLDMSSNSCASLLPNSLFHLKNLTYLDLSWNSFHGPIPTSLGNLSLVEEFIMRKNELSGPIPTSIGSLLSLKKVDLSSNKLSNEIPMSLGKLSNLVYLDLSGNLLKGNLSEVHFANLSKLYSLDLSSNSLSINVELGWLPPFQLIKLILNDCKLGPQFPPWIQTQINLVQLEMHNASIEGFVPFFLNNSFPNLYSLDFSDNQVLGMEFVNSNLLYRLDLSNNRISGPLPENISSMLPNLEYLFLSNNHINGSIPKSLCQMKSLLVIVVSNNNFSGHLPDCWSDLPSVNVIDFASNNLLGNIPASIGMLPMLNSLHLNKNNFLGEIPYSLRTCTSLVILDLGENKLSGEVPIWIGEDLSSLQILRLRINSFSGSISPKLCNLKSLRVLDVGHNALSGTIPHCFGNLYDMINPDGYTYTEFTGYDDPVNQELKGKELEYTKMAQHLVVNLDLSSNGFVGYIPEELTNLKSLIGLNLSNNHLTGNIPKNIGEMKSLESLDVSLNQLSGIIPQSISLLSSLSHLNLSYNNLSGRIPSGNQLQVLSDPATIYLGNSELCGSPLSKVCSGDEPSLAPKDANSKDGEEAEFNMNYFYIGMSCGVVVGFWGFCGGLFLNKSWRTAYFRFYQ